MATIVGFDPSLEEAARDLGASAVGAFMRITLPVIKPGVIAGALFAVIISWINVELSIFNTTAALMTLPVKLYNYIQYSVDPTIAAVAASTIYVVIMVVVGIDLSVGLDKVTTSTTNSACTRGTSSTPSTPTPGASRPALWSVGFRCAAAACWSSGSICATIMTICARP